MYLFKRGLPPNYFCNMFTLASQLHTRYTILIFETSQLGFKDLSFLTC